MIETVSDLLISLVEQERIRLNGVDIAHAPTIGEMYEGLTADVLERAIPAGLDLRVARGFIVDGEDGISGQIDCMLVRGEGEPIPYTDGFKWHVRDVLAVIEIKKSLLGSELEDAIQHLRSVVDLQTSYLHSQHDSGTEVDLRPALRAFAETTGKVAPSYETVAELPISEQLIFHTLVGEYYGPLRIVIGYDRYKSEYTFREGLQSILKKNIGKQGYGVGSFPQLAISGNYSLVKANGQPYSAPVLGGYWHFYLSSPSNPIRLLLELIWTKLERHVAHGAPWGSDLDQEVMHKFLAAQGVISDGRMGWEFRYIHASKHELAAQDSVTRWQPEFLDEVQFVIVTRLCEGRDVRLDDPELRTFLSSKGTDVDSVLDSFAGRGLVAQNGEELELITEDCQCLVLADGQFVAAENNTGRLTRWLAEQGPGHAQ
jgi:hypothetical protein